MKKEIMIILAIIVLLPILFFLAPTIFALLLVTGVIMLKLRYSVIKGAIGEWYVNKTLSKLGTNYKIYHDLYVPNGVGGTTQVDHVVTSPYGIFVIETKHYQGWIFGKENQKYWTQTIYKRKEKLFNPIWQNYSHIQAIKKYIAKEDFEFIYSIIAFSQNSTFKFKDDFTSARVIQFPKLIKVIKEWNVQRISASELKEIDRILEGLIITDKNQKKKVKKKHVVDIKNNRKEKLRKEKEDFKQNVCPKCGGGLTMKKGKYGSFYGCSNFPKCRYTKQVS
ncbi:NERD domain-containing protein [Mangrovibacillus cuniculi]|uniref:DNA topoisomerase I n=1 Tax=Mangrovibacillus cuniculi TaxID=2593652 RepID=A0A7S8CCV3_9BACI|nr:NERD domain-containing protein [Mangrovibacillus cuniculi]QPC47634.1 DNA topoisomerase I [Mangrovibacillus cuniculi]